MEMDWHGSANCLAAGVQVGEYRLERVIGEGGFGIVYSARDVSLDRVVAIKEYFPSTMAGRGASLDVVVRTQHKGAFDAGLRSFINEARLLAKFSHPSLVHVYRFFEANSTAYMVMHFYEGQTLRAFLAEQPRVSERWLTALLSPIFDALEMLHAADCYHRDIAPDNIFLSASGVPVLLDFGAARRIIGDMTQALTMVLKPGFAPIEQYVDDGTMPQGAWTDIYQLGAVIYQVITGTTPSTAVARMIKDPLKLLTPTDYPGYSTQFLEGIHAALQVHGKDRPQTMVQLREALGLRATSQTVTEPWTADAPVASAPVFAAPVIAPAAPISQPATPQAFDIETVLLTPVPTPVASVAPAPAPTLPPVTPVTPVTPVRAAPIAPPRTWITRRMLWGGCAALMVGGGIGWLGRCAPVETSPPVPLEVNVPVSTPMVVPTPITPELPPATASQAVPKEAPTPAPIPVQRYEPPPQDGVTPEGVPRTSAAPTSAPSPKPEKGSLSLKILPWGRVTVNKRFMGVSPPLTQLSLPVGKHTVEISNPAGKTTSRSVEITKDQSVAIEHRFEEEN